LMMTVHSWLQLNIFILLFVCQCGWVNGVANVCMYTNITMEI